MRAVVALLFLFCFELGAHAQEDLGFKAPPGFGVSLYAGDDLAHDIYSMTFDAQGRCVVAGAGYIKTLIDDDNDGRADRAVQFSDKPASGAHGMLCVGNLLYATGDNGIWKFRDDDEDGVADGPPEKWVDGLNHAEHGCNGIVMGPDGWIYVICGNDAGVTEKFATTPDSPVTKPNCGAILRFSPDGKKGEIVAHGFRNPYDLCFHPQGNIFTVDADGERDHHLPWYSPNRLFDVAIGMHHGWVQKGWQHSWNRPAYFFDNVERCAEIGRGSPTGMLCYRHTQFPAQYRGGIFSACWTLGRIYHFPLTPRGSTFDGKVVVFLETTGQVGFAPVDMAVGPDGSMYIAIGGRRTRGSVFKVTYTGPISERRREPANDLERVLDAPQPLDAWSREKWLPLAARLKNEELGTAVRDASLPVEWRLRAIEVATDLLGGILISTSSELATVAEAVEGAAGRTAPPDAAQILAARSLWSINKSAISPESALRLRKATENKSSLLERSFLENIADQLTLESMEFPTTNDRRAFSAYWKAMADASAHEKITLKNQVAKYSFTSNNPPINERLEDFREMVLGFNDSRVGVRDQQEILRQMSIALGDFAVEPGNVRKPVGYSFRLDEVLPLIESDAELRSDLKKIFAGYPYKNMKLDYELPRLAAALNWDQEEFVEHVSKQIGWLTLLTTISTI